MQLQKSLVVCRESSSSVKLFKNFKESNAIKTNFAAEALSGGSLLGIRGSDFVCFYDWASGKASISASALLHSTCCSAAVLLQSSEEHHCVDVRVLSRPTLQWGLHQGVACWASAVQTLSASMTGLLAS